MSAVTYEGPVESPTGVIVTGNASNDGGGEDQDYFDM